MRVLALDSGAERMGWASVGKEGERPYYHLSGILALERGNLGFQQYRAKLVEEVATSFPALIDLTQPDLMVNETIPAVGGGNFVAATQSYLANVAVTVAQTICVRKGLPFVQIGATTVQAKIAVGRKSRKAKVTKPQVRNGVIQLLPELEDRKKEWVKVFDEPDAIAVGLAQLGFTNV